MAPWSRRPTTTATQNAERPRCVRPHERVPQPSGNHANRLVNKPGEWVQVATLRPTCRRPFTKITVPRTSITSGRHHRPSTTSTTITTKKIVFSATKRSTVSWAPVSSEIQEGKPTPDQSSSTMCAPYARGKSQIQSPRTGAPVTAASGGRVDAAGPGELMVPGARLLLRWSSRSAPFTRGSGQAEVRPRPLASAASGYGGGHPIEPGQALCLSRGYSI